MQWFKNLRIRIKMIISFGLVIILFGVTAAFAVYHIGTIEAAYNNVLAYPLQSSNVIRDFRTESRELQRLVATIAAETGYAATGADRIEELYKDATSAYDQATGLIEDYRKIYRSNPALDSDAIAKRDNQTADLYNLIKKYKDETLDPMYQTALTGTDGYQAVMGLLVNNEDTLESLRQLAADMSDTVSKTADTGTAKAKAEAETARSTVLFFSIAAIIISIVLAVIIASVISKPIQKLIEVAGHVSKGRLNVNLDTSLKDETGVLNKNFGEIIKVIQDLIANVTEVSDNFEAGDLQHVSIDVQAYNGEFQNITAAINKTIALMIEDNLSVTATVGEIANGNFNFAVKQLPGEKAVLTAALQSAKDNLLNFSRDIVSLINSAKDGNLNVNVDTGKYKGDWNLMASDLNQLISTIAVPISEVSSVLSYISSGDFKHKMEGVYKGDFLKLEETINKTVTNIASYIDEIALVLSKLAQNDLNQGITREYTGSFTIIKDALNNIIDTLNRVVGNIMSAAEQVSAGAKTISESSMTLASGATEQASSIEELNATVSTINEIAALNAESARNAETLSHNSKSNASRGDTDMNGMLSAMDGIKDSSSKISKIIKVIEDIAFQTNLLALNAAVEAARAGEHGKGFAVVAEEVRTLASRSQAAAGETASLIEESIGRVEEGAHLADKTADALKTIVSDIDKIAEIITSITGSSQNQAEAVKQVVTGLEQITNVTQTNSATSEEAASASQQLSGQSEIMKSYVSEFKLKKK